MIDIEKQIESLREWHRTTGAPSYKESADILTKLNAVYVAAKGLSKHEWYDDYNGHGPILRAAIAELENEMA